ncbi:S4 domain-containing protein YaaA [Bacillus sp. FSL W7-1360]|uniref:S4 domain protein YaaA n=1 Tax=Shouchella lonarensis TaxID=1464122 RepID=A0A1G6NNC7_9BACI|nr:S4 domain-containing protein YaaA [Shouchella lonarensis]SDC68874.1 S4 domain protein YaaA [Shouchella lonarensis]
MIKDDTITLGQLLKEIGVIQTGGMAKWYLAEYVLLVNGEKETRRGKKLCNADVVTLEDGQQFQVVQRG